MRTRSCGSSWTGCAGTSSLILRSVVSTGRSAPFWIVTRTGHGDGCVCRVAGVDLSKSWVVTEFPLDCGVSEWKSALVFLGTAPSPA